MKTKLITTIALASLLTACGTAPVKDGSTTCVDYRSESYQRTFSGGKPMSVEHVPQGTTARLLLDKNKGVAYLGAGMHLSYCKNMGNAFHCKHDAQLHILTSTTWTVLYAPFYTVDYIHDKYFDVKVTPNVACPS